MHTKNSDTPFHAGFVVVNHILRLDKCVLLCWRGCRCLGSNVWLGIIRSRFVLPSRFLIAIQSFINLWLLMVLVGLLGHYSKF